MIALKSQSDFLDTIYSTLGYSLKEIEPGKFHRFGPRKSGWAKLFDDYAGGVFGCYRQGIKSHWSARKQQSPAEIDAMHQRVHHAMRERAIEQRAQWAKNALRNAELWARAQQVQSGDPVHRYLAARGLGNWAIPSCIRFHPGLAYWDCDDDGEFHHLGNYPTMVAKLVGRDGHLLALHRTYLGDGCKGDVPTPRKLTAASSQLSGASIPLAELRGGVIGIAEGIETAAAAALGSGVPVVSAYCAQALSTFHWPQGTERLIVFADNDPAGQHAAASLVQRAKRAGIAINAKTPIIAGTDWCDVWQTRGHAE